MIFSPNVHHDDDDHHHDVVDVCLKLFARKSMKGDLNKRNVSSRKPSAREIDFHLNANSS